jgi:hypothetical protein
MEDGRSARLVRKSRYQLSFDLLQHQEKSQRASRNDEREGLHRLCHARRDGLGLERHDHEGIQNWINQSPHHH